MQVYQDVTEPRQAMEFDKVSTVLEVAAEQMKQNGQFHYYRLPVPDQKTGLTETVSSFIYLISNYLIQNKLGPAAKFSSSV